jgi:hypothetical protein
LSYHENRKRVAEARHSDDEGPSASEVESALIEALAESAAEAEKGVEE